MTDLGMRQRIAEPELENARLLAEATQALQDRNEARAECAAWRREAETLRRRRRPEVRPAR